MRDAAPETGLFWREEMPTISDISQKEGREGRRSGRWTSWQAHRT